VFQTSRPSTARRCASSGGQASPPKISSRTSSSASTGHSAASVGTVDTTEMRCSASHPPRSTPLRTSDRSAGTRQAPCRQASHISSQDASNATDSPARTRSCGPIASLASPARNSCASASTNAAAAPWLTATPFGVPVEPEVKMIQASSAGPGRPVRPPGARRGDTASPSPSTAQTPASAKTSSARSSGSSASTGT
jgi:hypothetical protein